MCGEARPSPFHEQQQVGCSTAKAVINVCAAPVTAEFTPHARPLGDSDEADSRSSSPRACGHGRRAQTRQRAGKAPVVIPAAVATAAAAAGCAAGCSPLVSPRSACSTPGGTNNSLGLQLHALVFLPSPRCSVGRQQGAGAGAGAGTVRGLPLPPPASPSLSASLSPSPPASPCPLAPHRTPPARACTSADLRRFSGTHDRAAAGGSSSSSSRGGGGAAAVGAGVLASIAALGLQEEAAEQGTRPRRGSISRAKQVLAEAVGGLLPGGSGGLGAGGSYCVASCSDTGVLAPLLHIIRHGGSTTARCASSLSEAASTSSSSSSSSSSTVGGFACGSTPPAARGSSSSSSPVRPLVGSSTLEDGELQQQQQRQRRVLDCMETVRYLSMDDSNRNALIDLGAVELLLSKLDGGAAAAAGCPELQAAALSALCSLCRQDAAKCHLWESPGAAQLLLLLSSRHNGVLTRAAHSAAAALAWSGDAAAASRCSSASLAALDAFGSSGGDSCGSSFDAAPNVLLAPSVIGALARALHPAADVPVLLSALRLLTRAACSLEVESPAPPPRTSPAVPASAATTPTAAATTAAAPNAVISWHAGWAAALFAVMPLLLPSQRVQGGAVLAAALELLLSLTERHPGLHRSIAGAGCLPPLLAQVAKGRQTASLQAACVLTGMVDTPAARERLRGPASLALLLRVLQDERRSTDVRLAAVHLLRRLAGAEPSVVALLRSHGAAPAIAALLHQVADADVRRAGAALLKLLGAAVPKTRAAAGGSSSSTTTTTKA